jgi:hypothetical protein
LANYPEKQDTDCGQNKAEGYPKRCHEQPSAKRCIVYCVTPLFG